MDPPNVLWFFGAYVIEVGVYALIETIPKSQDGLWRLVTAVGLFVAFVLLAAALLRRWWWVPGGLAAALAVGAFPAVAVGFLQLIDVWPNESFLGPFSDFSGYWFGVALATAAVGLLACRAHTLPVHPRRVDCDRHRRGATVVPCFVEGPSGERTARRWLWWSDRLLVIAGIFLDAFGRRREAFWFHVLGWLTVAGGLVWFTVDSSGDIDRGWLPMLIVGLVLLLSAGADSPGDMGGLRSARLLRSRRALPDGRARRRSLALRAAAPGARPLDLCVRNAHAPLRQRVVARRFVRRPPPALSP